MYFIGGLFLKHCPAKQKSGNYTAPLYSNPAIVQYRCSLLPRYSKAMQSLNTGSR